MFCINSNNVGRLLALLILIRNVRFNWPLTPNGAPTKSSFDFMNGANFPF